LQPVHIPSGVRGKTFYPKTVEHIGQNPANGGKHHQGCGRAYRLVHFEIQEHDHNRDHEHTAPDTDDSRDDAQDDTPDDLFSFTSIVFPNPDPMLDEPFFTLLLYPSADQNMYI